MKTSTCIALFLFLGALHQSNAFVSPSMTQSFSMASGNLIQPTSTLSMLPDNFDFNLDLDFGSDWTSQFPSFPWMQKVQDPTVEVEVLHGLAHVTLDFSGILFDPPKEMLRLLPVVGRLIVMLADYLPDHSINPTEFVIQLFFFSLASKDLARELSLRRAIAESRKERQMV